MTIIDDVIDVCEGEMTRLKKPDPPVLLVTDDACAQCPINLLCLTQTALAAAKVCTRCWTLRFKINSQEFYCGRLRFGHWPRKKVRRPTASEFLCQALGLNSLHLVMAKNLVSGCVEHFNFEREGHLAVWKPEHPLNFVELSWNPDENTMDSVDAAWHRIKGSKFEVDIDDCIHFLRKQGTQVR